MAREPAERDLAGEDARELEGGAALDIAAVGIAPEAEEVGLQIVDALVAADLDERLHAGRELVAAAQLHVVAVVVAVCVARTDPSVKCEFL